MYKLFSIVATVFVSFGSSAVGLEDLLPAPVSQDPVRTNVVEAAASEELVEQVAESGESAAKPVAKASRPAKITSESVTYDRKEGLAVFTGNVFVDDERYQLHADRVYVFTEQTNDLKRIVAFGNVAMTNDTKSAHGVKASYHRANGMVVLYGDEKTPAEVRNVTKSGDQTLVGERIRFWIDKEQVEVLKVKITTPTGELKASDLRKAL